MYHKAAIINYVIVKIQQMLHSVMEHIEISLERIINHTEDFMKSGVKSYISSDLFTCIGIGILDKYK